MDIRTKKRLRSGSSELNKMFDIKKSAMILKKDSSIYILEKFEDKGLIKIGNSVSILGSFAVVSGKHYAVFNSMAMYDLGPVSIDTEVVDDQSYYRFDMEKGSTLFTSNVILVDGDIVATVVDVYLFLGNHPFFHDKDDMTKLLLTTSKHAGVTIDVNPSLIAQLSEIQQRDTKDVYLPARLSKSDKISYVSLRSKIDGVTSSYNKITGRYQRDGISSAMVKESLSETTPTEEIVRY